MLSIVQHDNDGKRSAAAARCDLVEKGPLAAAVSFLQQSPQITPQHIALVDVRALQASFCSGVEIGDYLLDALVQAATKKEIGTVGGFICQGCFRQMNAGQNKVALGAALGKPVSVGIAERLQALWPWLWLSLEIGSSDVRSHQR